MAIEIPYTDRPQHIYMPGKTRYGKSTLIFWLALEDIKNDQGVTVMDAKGDLIRNLLKAIPNSKREKAVYLSLDQPVPIDIMSATSDREKEHLVGELKDIITRGIGTKDAYTVDKNLTDLIYTLLDYNDNPEIKPDRRACFLDILWFLQSESRRNEIRIGIKDEELKAIWERPIPHPQFSAQDIGRITGRMNPWARSKSLRKIFGVPSPKLNIDRIYNEQGIILAKLGIDEINSIWGTILLSKLLQAAIRQDPLPEPDRTPHFLYCDEFQNFQTKDFDKMLSMAGGYGLCLCLAHQYADQLDSQILHAIIGVISNFIIFRLGAPTANVLKPEIPSMHTEKVWKRNPDSGLMEWMTQPLPFDAHELMNLPKFQVLHRRADGTATYESFKKWPLFTSDGNAECIKLRTVTTYRGEPLKIDYAEVNASNHNGHDDFTPPPTDAPQHERKKRNPRTPR